MFSSLTDPYRQRLVKYMAAVFLTFIFFGANFIPYEYSCQASTSCSTAKGLPLPWSGVYITDFHESVQFNFTELLIMDGLIDIIAAFVLVWLGFWLIKCLNFVVK